MGYVVGPLNTVPEQDQSSPAIPDESGFAGKMADLNANRSEVRRQGRQGFGVVRWQGVFAASDLLESGPSDRRRIGRFRSFGVAFRAT